MFLTDDHGQWAQHAYGNSELKTPNMDRLADQGVRMNQAITPCPVCSPARASFFTGRMPSQHGVTDWLNDTQCPDHPGLKGQTLISDLLKKAGYNTGLVGKWHCGAEREPKPGFDKYFSYWVSQYPHGGTSIFPIKANWSRTAAVAVADGARDRFPQQAPGRRRNERESVLPVRRLCRHALAAQSGAG